MSKNRSLIMAMSVLILGACAKTDNNKLIVGMELAYPPFETKDIEGNPYGVSVDIAYALGEYLGKEVVIENTGWSGLIPALQTKKVDLIISSMGITEDRKKQVAFSEPYSKASIAMLVSAKSDVLSVEDLNQKGRVVAVKQGTVPFLYAHRDLTNATINSFTSESAAVTEVIQGKADAMLYDQLTIYKNWQSNPDTTRMVAIKLADEDIDFWGIGINKNNTNLITNVNAFLKEFKEKNGYEPIIEKHLKKEKILFDEYGFDFFF